MARIVLDPGHGGTDPGAVAGGVKEVDLCLSVVVKVETALMNMGHSVTHYVAPANVPDSLAARLAYANKVKPDAFVSIHVNAGPPTGNGFEVLVDSNPPGPHVAKSRLLADKILAALDALTPGKNRGRKDMGLYVLNQKRPCCLVEIGFLTNKKERGYITSKVGKLAIAKAIAEGIDNFL